MSLVCTLAGCSVKAPVYESVDDYPVRKGALDEMVYSPSKTTFSVWSPAADSVRLRLYAEGLGGEAIEEVAMRRGKDGTWTCSVRGDLQGKFYTFQVKQSVQSTPPPTPSPQAGRGSDVRQSVWLEETPGIFAKAVGVNGRRGAVVDLRSTDPEGWAEDVRPALAGAKDAIVYEMHYRDYTIHPSSGVVHKGKFLGLTEEGTKQLTINQLTINMPLLSGEESTPASTTSQTVRAELPAGETPASPVGMATGIEHLKELGVTHVQILPSYDYGSIDETRLADNKYNWGYDPVNYNVPEGGYSTNPYEPACRIREMKQMIQALHKAGIRVVMDVVYNHTFDVAHSNFHNTCPGYFYRYNADGSLGNASGCGNETASERGMMRKFIVESCRYWLTEYHIDGFRFDLMGIHDIETMREVRAMMDGIDPTLLLYGEGWAAGAPLLPQEELAMKANILEIEGVGAFCDDMRDALRGPFSDDHQGAFLAGEKGHEESIKFGIAGCIDHPDVDMSRVNYSKAAWAAEPTQCISYVSCHDDMMLTDRLKASVRLQKGELERLDKLAQTAVLTSQGIPFLWNGEEILRDKKGVHNSYCSPDSINAIDWSLKAQHEDVFRYYQGLIALRKAHPAFRMGDAELVRQHLHFLDAPEGVVAYMLDGEAVGDEWKTIVVVLNANRKAVEVALPAGTYRLACGDGKCPYSGMRVDEKTTTVSAQSAQILHTIE
ncbi:MAG: type I pullulanase [Paludibacteraceae bacterium]|nr:type I pullulanase [Paludibacteraceae bacterium]